MKWQAIANVTGQINDEAKGYLVRKLEKDASVEIPNLWSDFITDTTRHLHKSESNLEIAGNEKTGSLTCLTRFDELHEDFSHNNRPFLDYVLGKYDQRAASYLSRARNPITRKYLQQKIGNYKIHLAEQISATEARLIDGKRHNMAIAAIEKLKSATYDNPRLYEEHLQDSRVAITSLSLLPAEKDKLLHSAKEELAYAAALGSLKHSPESILNPQITPAWKADLSFENRVRLENQASMMLAHKQAMTQNHVKSLSKAHLASILKTGRGIAGFDNLLSASFAANDPALHRLRQQEALHKEAFLVAEQLKMKPLNEGYLLLKRLAPKSGDIDYDRREEIYKTLAKQLDEHISGAKADPAKFVEDLFSEEIPQDAPLLQRLLLRKQLQEQKGIPDYRQKYLMEEEKQDYLDKISGEANGSNANEIKKEIDTIMRIGKGEYQIGPELLKEILHDQKKLSPPIHFYAENYLYKAASKERSLLADTFARIIAIQAKLTSHASGPQEQELNKELNDNKALRLWCEDMKLQQPHNLPNIELTEKGVEVLARFYQHNFELKAGVAVKRAVKEMISDIYFSPLDGLQIPRQIIEDGGIYNLNEDYIRNSLINLRRDLINGTVSYDQAGTFGQTGEFTDFAAEKMTGMLTGGRWFLSPDKNSVYYAYLNDNGYYYPVMVNEDNVLTFDLRELNMPERESVRIQRLNDEMRELLEKLPLNTGH